MSLYQGKVIHLILLERFGPIVADVGEVIFPRPCSFAQIRTSTGYPPLKVKEVLAILIKFNLASFKLNNNGTTAIYSLKSENIFLILRYPKFINLIKKKMATESEVLVEELLYKGYSIASELITKTATRLKENKNISILLKQLKDKFVSLVTAKYFKRVPRLNMNQKEQFLVPKIDVKQLILIMNGGNESPGDEDIYWMINADRFHQDLRDQLIINAVAKKFDDNAGELMRILLQNMNINTAPWVPISNPVPILEVKKMVKKQNTHQELVEYFEQYVSVLEEDSSNIIRKVGEASGGSYEIAMKQIFTQLTWETVELIVNEKFGTKASRIFRLIKSQSYIEPDQIQNLVMIPAKEVKQISYQLLEENYLVLKELKKSLSGSTPNRSFNLFFIQLDQIVRATLERCYKTLFNQMAKGNHEKFLKERVIDKKKKVDIITMAMRGYGASSEQLIDIKDMITPPESEMLERLGKMMKKLAAVELEVDNTIFLLQMYLAYE